jgi:hypothetical protein
VSRNEKAYKSLKYKKLSAIACASGRIGEIPAPRGTSDPRIGIRLGNLLDRFIQPICFQMFEATKGIEHQFRLVGGIEARKLVQVPSIQDLDEDSLSRVVPAPCQSKRRIPSYFWDGILKHISEFCIPFRPIQGPQPESAYRAHGWIGIGKTSLEYGFRSICPQVGQTS